MFKMLLWVLTLYSFTQLALQERAASELLRSPRQTGACVLPPYPDNGVYEVSNVPEAKPGQMFDYAVLTINCRRGYGVLESTDDAEETSLRTVYCINGKWSQSIPKCVRFCKLEPDPSIRYMCQVTGTNGFKTCDKYVVPGTSVSPVCNSPIYYSPEPLLYMKCTAGTWDYVAKCKPECGRVTPEGKQLIIDGRPAKRGELPWHVGIYRKTFKPYKQICGGTLVSNSLIISAAHCFWHDIKKVLPATDFAAAIGKLYRPWNGDHDIDAQKSDVKDIRLPHLFEGEAANFQEDIAILTLVTPFVYKTYVRPVCLSFDVNFDRWQLQQGKIGKVAGWGLTSANGHASQILKVVEIPYISTETCINKLPSSFREYITRDKFCAGRTNGTALCRGDSGGGLAFADKELGIDRYYLRGIASAAPKHDNKSCNDQAYTTFTKISKHEEFIKQSVASLVEKICALSEFQCSDRGCVEQDAECNGKKDCQDGSDEADSLCKPESADDLDRNSQACILPPYPKHGTYAVANLPSFTPGQFLGSFVLTVTCDEGYGIADPNGNTDATNNQQVYCVNGAWYQIMPKCIRFCRVQPDPSVLFVTCQVPVTGFHSCPDYVPPGTTVIPMCNTQYFSSKALPFMTCLNGTWDYIARCQPAFCKLDLDSNTRYMCPDEKTSELELCSDYVKSGVTATPTCNNPNNRTAQVFKNMTCTLGVWSHVAKCKTDSCQLHQDPSIHYRCKDETGELTPCRNYTVPVGTIVKPVCNKPYYYSVEDIRDMTCTDESWDYIPKCQPECGRITTLKLQTTRPGAGHDNILSVESEIIPWHVGIVRKEETKPMYKFGTLVRNNVVITDAHSFYDFWRHRVDTFTRYAAVSKQSAFLDNIDHIQESDVTSINVLSTLPGSQGVLGDIAVLLLAKPFTFNLYLSPVCLDFDIDFEEHQLEVGNTAKVGNWKHYNKNELSVLDINTCINNLPDIREVFEDKICTTYEKESEPFLITHSNAGVVFPYNNSGVIRYYFRGILDGGCYTVIDGHPACTYNYSWSTRISRYKDFIQQYL